MVNTWGFWKVDVEAEELAGYSNITDDIEMQLKLHVRDTWTSKRNELILANSFLSFSTLLKLINSQVRNKFHSN